MKAIDAVRIVQLNTHDRGGGAARVAHDLWRHQRRHGMDAWLAVGRRTGFDAEGRIVSLGTPPALEARLTRLAERVARHRGRRRGAGALWRLLTIAANPRRAWCRWRGCEDHPRLPGHRLLERFAGRNTLIHAHNLHGGYFDPAVLPALTGRLPVVLTLHDAWLLTGHCAHPMDCQRWRVGCGRCPDLDRWPPIRRDATARNWRRKRTIFAHCRIHLATPCRWLMRWASDSLLAPALIETRIIANGVDPDVFYPADRRAARRQLGLDPDAAMVLFVAHGLDKNPYKDFETLRRTIARLHSTAGQRGLTAVAVGALKAPGPVTADGIQRVPYVEDPQRMALYYQATDVFLHAARAETFPLTTLEAMACGRPVVASAVGGIPEQVIDQVTGYLVPPGDDPCMSERVSRLIHSREERRTMGRTAAAHVRRHFTLQRQANAYRQWFDEILANRGAPAPAPSLRRTAAGPGPDGRR